MDLSGRAALVTGAAQGFGFACADRLSEAGASVLLVDRTQDRLSDAEARLSRLRRRTAAALTDVTHEADVESAVRAAVEAFGRVDILVNCAGVFSNFLLDNLTTEEFQRLLNVNVIGSFLCTKATVGQLRRQSSGGVIINVSSINSIRPNVSGLSHYDASKGAIASFTRAMALELGPEGIRVNAIAPGPSLTEGAIEFVQAGASGGIDVEEQWSSMAAQVPLGRLCKPDEVGRAAVFLASDFGSYINGTQLVIDGGYLLRR